MVKFLKPRNLANTQSGLSTSYQHSRQNSIYSKYFNVVKSIYLKVNLLKKIVIDEYCGHSDYWHLWEGVHRFDCTCERDHILDVNMVYCSIC